MNVQSKSRLKPYTTNQVSWKIILNKYLRIPMNQREFEWENGEIHRFLDDLFQIFVEKKYCLKMGSIINLNYNSTDNIYDGQQRTLTTILILNVIGCLGPEKLRQKIKDLLTIDTDIDDLTPEQQNIKKKYNVNIIPRIYCVNPNDMEGLVKIFNNKVNLWCTYVDNIEEMDSFIEHQNYVCKKCKTPIARKLDFIRHIKNQHNFEETKLKSNLSNAFTEIYNYFVLKKYDEKQLINLYKFIVNDIDIQYYDCNDRDYVSRIFDWENNRGKNVKKLDIIKNPILVNVPDDKKIEVYEKWENLKKMENKIYKKEFGQKLFNIAIQIYNNKIKRTIDLEELFKPIIEHEDTYQEINKFFDIVEKLFEIMNKISNDKFGRLLNNNRKIKLTWESYMYCMLPIFYHTENINSKLIELIVRWYFRNSPFKTRTFNNLCYSNRFIEIVNEFLIDKTFDYFEEINKCLQKNKDSLINNDNYISSLTTINIGITNATHLLLYLETKITTDLNNVSLDYSLEHIFSQKDKEKLKDQSLMNNIGNLTLLEKKNSKNGHRGNSSLGAKNYTIKRAAYEGSSSHITRTIAKKHETFSEEDIKKRNKYIVELLNKHTNY